MEIRLTTTFEMYKGTPRGNYCTLPTRDVEILTDPDRCNECGKTLVYTGTPGNFDPWTHEDGSPGRNIAPVQRCYYCRGTDSLSHVAGSWHDGVNCARCGGERGYPIGD